MKRVLSLAFFVICLCAASCQQGDKQLPDQTAPNDSSTITLITAQELSEKLEAGQVTQLIDVRTPAEFQQGTIDGAQNIDFRNSKFTVQFEQAIDKNKPVYIFCRSGRRSAAAAQQLKAIGYTQVYDLKGGYLNWQKKQ